MEDLKSFALYNQRLNKLIKSYQTHKIKNPYSLHSLEATLSKNSNSKKNTENQNPLISKMLYINTQFDHGMKEFFPKNSLIKPENNQLSVSKAIMNYSPDNRNKINILPFLKGKKNNLKNRKSRSELNKSQGFQNSQSKMLIEENSSKIMHDSHHIFMFNKEQHLIPKPYTPIKISLKYRKNFEKKVDGKFDIPSQPQQQPSKTMYITNIFKNWN